MSANTPTFVWLVVCTVPFEGIRSDSITACTDLSTAELLKQQRDLAYGNSSEIIQCALMGRLCGQP